jgi:hypothetical protein
MTINGKRDGFTAFDLREVARVAGLKQGRSRTIFAEVSEAVRGWPAVAEQTGLDESIAEQVARSHRLTLPAG